ncbi:hypothetical protein QPK87_07040 [Kamptonema cortianum]|nr:hypothetical protein [Kamptonema cortianum]
MFRNRARRLEQRIARMWSWAAKNPIQLSSVTQISMWTRAMGNFLVKINPGLRCGLGRSEANELQFQISPNRKVELVPLVEQIVDVAPALEGVHVVAFIQSTSSSFLFDDHEITQDEIRVMYPRVAEDGAYHLTLYLPFKNGLKNSDLDSIAWDIAERALGERFLIERVSKCDAVFGFTDERSLPTLEEFIEILGQSPDGIDPGSHT